MEDDSDLQMNDAWSGESNLPPKRTRVRPSGSKLRPVLLVILVAVVLAGGIFYFINGRSSGGAADPLQLKMAAFEQKISSLERQIVDLQGKSGPVGSDPALLQRMEALAQKVEALEKRPLPPTPESKAKPPSPKSAVSTEKRYHTVQKGETLYKISKKYGITVEELRKLNNLSRDRSVRPGQKVVVPSEK